MKRKNASVCVRINLENEADRNAWEYLQRLDRKAHKSYSRVFITALNDYIERQTRLAGDPYLETREVEQAFLQRVLDTIESGVRETVPQYTTGDSRPSVQKLTTPIAAEPPAGPDTETENDAAILEFLNDL